ncbi:MAG TPA: glycine cleavage system protein H, partial [Candidatus Kryptobacter bacterium]|nr:glycine cleavage system protein H [Candidatus Kryptobacter bacterium]
MVALFVVATIIIFLGIDYFVQRAAKRKAALSPAAQVSAKPRFMIPKGYFFGKGHTWVELLPDGLTRVGLDDFVQKILGPVGEVEPIPVNTIVRKGDKLFTVRQGGKEMSFRAPISGKVVAFNDDLSHSPGV